MTPRDVKDKRIERAGLAYVASVHVYDGRVISAGRHITMRSAQIALSKYPNDVFEGCDDPTRSRESFKEKKPRKAPHRRKEVPYTRLYDRRIF